MEKTRRQSMVLMSLLLTSKSMSSVMGFRSDTMPRPAKEMDMMRMRESLQEDDAQTEARPQADRRLE